MSEKKAGCHSCKKKKEEIDETNIPTENNNQFSNEEILWTLTAMRASGMSKEHKIKANTIYRSIFNEDINFGCGGCKDSNLRKLEHYVQNVLQL